jgi:hypothetical protein
MELTNFHFSVLSEFLVQVMIVAVSLPFRVEEDSFDSDQDPRWLATSSPTNQNDTRQSRSRAPGTNSTNQ